MHTGRKFYLNQEVLYKGEKFKIFKITTSGTDYIYLYSIQHLTNKNVIVDEVLEHLLQPIKEEKNNIKPDHYNIAGLTGYEVIEAISGIYPATQAFNVGNVIKYVFGAPNKNGVEDLKKAREYLDRVIEKWEGE